MEHYANTQDADPQETSQESEEEVAGVPVFVEPLVMEATYNNEAQGADPQEATRRPVVEEEEGRRIPAEPQMEHVYGPMEEAPSVYQIIGELDLGFVMEAPQETTREPVVEEEEAAEPEMEHVYGPMEDAPNVFQIIEELDMGFVMEATYNNEARRADPQETTRRPVVEEEEGRRMPAVPQMDHVYGPLEGTPYLFHVGGGYMEILLVFLQLNLFLGMIFSTFIVFLIFRYMIEEYGAQNYLESNEMDCKII